MWSSSAGSVYVLRRQLTLNRAMNTCKVDAVAVFRIIISHIMILSWDWGKLFWVRNEQQQLLLQSRKSRNWDEVRPTKIQVQVKLHSVYMYIGRRCRNSHLDLHDFNISYSSGRLTQCMHWKISLLAPRYLLKGILGISKPKSAGKVNAHI